MGTDQFTEYLCDNEVSKEVLKEELWDSSVVRPSAEHDQRCPIEARYGGDELWSVKALNAGTDIPSEHER